MAAEKGRCEQILGYLVGRGADINIKDKNGVNICHCKREMAVFINDSLQSSKLIGVFYDSAAKT